MFINLIYKYCIDEKIESNSSIEIILFRTRVEENMAERIDYENLIIDLYLFWRLKRKRGRVTTAKLIYLFEDELFNKNMIGSRYKMFKHDMGPYNLNISKNLVDLSRSGFLSYDSHYFEKINKDVETYFSNEKTEQFIKKLDELIQENYKIFNIFDEIIQNFGDLNSDLLIELVYSLNKTGSKKKKIEDYKPKSLILDPLSLPNPNFIFELDENWYDTVEVLLDPNLYKMAMDTLKNIHQDKYIRLQ